MKPTLIVLAGPNGAGNSTLYQVQVAPFFTGPSWSGDIPSQAALFSSGW